MAEKIPKEDKLENHDVDLFEILDALDKKDYDYYSRLTKEQQSKIVPYLLLQWISAIKGQQKVQHYYLQSTEYHANLYFLDQHVSKHPELQWKMLCAVSPQMGKQFHQWIPRLKEKVSNLKEPAVLKDVKEYFKKLYPSADNEQIGMAANEFTTEQHKKTWIANKFPEMKLNDIELLSKLITDDEIKNYEKNSGN